MLETVCRGVSASTSTTWKDSKKHHKKNECSPVKVAKNAQDLTSMVIGQLFGKPISCQHFPTLSQSARFHQAPVRMQRINT